MIECCCWRANRPSTRLTSSRAIAATPTFRRKERSYLSAIGLERGSSRGAPFVLVSISAEVTSPHSRAHIFETDRYQSNVDSILLIGSIFRGTLSEVFNLAAPDAGPRKFRLPIVNHVLVYCLFETY